MGKNLFRIAKQKKIKYFLISFVDLFGILRSKLVPTRAINEMQKSGVQSKDVKSFLKYCKNEIKLNVIGLMVLPPNDDNTEKYFSNVSQLNYELGLKDLSMGMSSDYKIAIKYKSTFLSYQ